MEIRIRETGQAVSEREFRDLHPNTSFPAVINAATLADFGADPVLEAPAPTVTQYQSAYRNGVVQDALGNWVYAWAVRDWTLAEIDAAKQAASAALQKSTVDATQQRLDAFAQTRSYDGILSACTYATSPTPSFAKEGAYCLQVRDATWAKLYAILADVKAGLRPMPTGYGEIEPELPVLAWPL